MVKNITKKDIFSYPYLYIVLYEIRHKISFQFFIVFATYIAAGILDLVLSVVGEIFTVYSYALFIVIFAVGGIFAAVFSLSQPGYLKGGHFSLLTSFIFNIIIGLLYYFPFRILLAASEYAGAMRSFSILFMAASVFFYWLYNKEEHGK
jgi:hypothetical protein